METLTLSQVADAVEEMLVASLFGSSRAKQRQIAQLRLIRMQRTGVRNRASAKAAKKKRVRDLHAAGITISRLKRVQRHEDSL